MPSSTRWNLTYELLFAGDAEWTDITALVDSRQTKISDAGCSTDLKSVISTCSFEMRYNASTTKSFQTTIVGKILEAKEDGEIVRFRMGGDDTFVGKVDLGNFSQRNGRFPGHLTVDCEDNSYLLDEKMPTSFEYPTNDDLTDAGYAVFDKDNLATSIISLLLIGAGYSAEDIDLATSDSITDKIRRVVYDADDERTYREMIDTILFEHCAVLYPQGDGKMSVRKLYQESPESARTITAFLDKDGITTTGGDYQFNGVKIKWANLSVLEGAVLYNANITIELDEDGNRKGEEIVAQHYWPENGDIEETWQEFNATFLDRPYQTKQSRLKNKDLAIVSVKNAYYAVDKDSDIILANNPPEIEPLKARVLFYNNHATDSKKIYGFTIEGDALYRNKLNETTYPINADKLDSPYETEFVFSSTVADRLANHLHRFRKYGDISHKWAELNVACPMFQVVNIAPNDTEISSLAMVISQTRTYPAPNVIKRENTAIGITSFSSEQTRTRSSLMGGTGHTQGPAGDNGTITVVQYALGTIDAPYEYGSTIVGTDLAIVGTSLAILGTDNSGVWTTSAPTPALNEYVWRREGQYIPPAVWPSEWEVMRITGNKGDSAVHGELNNDSHTVPTDVDGNDGNYSGCASTLHMFVGGTDDSANWTFSADVAAGITGSLTDNTYTVTDMSVDTAYVDITASKSGYSDVTRRFTISKSKQGAIGASPTAYWLISDVAAIKKTEAGAYVPTSVSFTAKSQTGDSAPANYAGRFVISESTDGLAWTPIYTSESDEATKSHTPSSGIVALKCQLYQAGGTLVLLDEEIIPIVLDGATGTDAQGISLTASRGVINTTSRGAIYGSDIIITATLQNITGTVAWSVDSGTGTLTGADNLFRTLDISTVATNEIVIKATIGGFSATYGFAKVADGQPAPYNFGGVTAVPTETPTGEPLVAGDYFLWAGTTGTYTKGKIYEWSGSAWVLSTNGDLVMTMFDSFAELANDVDSTVIGNAVIKKLVTIEAFIENLKARMLEVIDGTYSLKVNNTDGLKIVKNGVTLLEAPPSGGLNIKGTIIAGSSVPYSTVTSGPPADADKTSTFIASGTAFQTANGKFKVKTDGSIEAVDGNLKGALTVESDDSTYVANIDKTNGIKQTKSGVTTFHAKPDGDVMLGNYNPSTKTGGIYYDKSEDKLLGNVAYDQWDLVIQSDSDLALLTTGTTTYENVLIAPGTYNINAQLDLPAHGVKQFVGCGVNQSVLNINYVLSTHLLRVTDTLIELGNFRITSNKTQTSTSATLIYVPQALGLGVRVNIHDIKIDSMSNKTIGIGGGRVDRFYDIVLNNIFITNCYSGFIGMAQLNSCYAVSCASIGFGTSSRLTNCIAHSCGTGFSYCFEVSSSHADACETGFSYCQYITSSFQGSSTTTGWSNCLNIDYDSTNCDQQWTLGSMAINHGVTYTLPKGSYIFYRINPMVSILLQVYDGSTWYNTSTSTNSGTVVSDGTNMRLINASEDTNATVYWRKKP